MSKKFDHLSIEKKWQNYWEEKSCFSASLDKGKKKYYILDMFPYPSGAGLHVGHVTGYTATDIVARYKRQQGFNVLHPMGWDSFGLQAEQYAVRTGQHPAKTTETNVNTYRRQLKSLGFSYDWEREFATSDPKYFKWTQWIFTLLYDKGLAYEAEVLVNYCPHLGTVLANEEVEDGKAKEGGYPVERRPLRQWVLKITEYAEQLLRDLDELDWPEYLKTLQRNWIGKSEGANITFSLEGEEERITVFTTRPDTIFGVSYLTLAPEHPLLDTLVPQSHKASVEEYRKAVSTKSDLERTELAKEKTGVFSGLYAKHPITGEKVPIWVADYVLISYGTGAVMGVPAHDQRDYEFAKTYDLEILPVYTTFDSSENKAATEGGTVINSKHGDVDLNNLEKEKAIEKAIAALVTLGSGEKCTSYKLRDWLFSRQRYWGEPFPILHFEDGSKRTLGLDELPLTAPELTDYKPSGDGQSPLAKVKEWIEITDPVTGKRAKRESNTMPQWAGSCWYYLRFCDPLNENEAWSHEAEKYWMPVDLYVGGVEHAVLHLLYARFWHKVLYDCGLVSTKEPFASLRNQGLVTAKSFKIPGGGYVSPEEVDSHEGEPLIEQVEKMSKSKLNGVPPDQMIEEYGADALRLYEMFMGPFDKEKLWNTDAVLGCRRFLDRFYALVTSEKAIDEEDAASLKLANKLVAGVEKDIQEMSFNTAIAKFMEFVNGMMPLEKYSKKALRMASVALCPFAPHIAEECYLLLGGEGTLTNTPFPTVDPSYLEEDTVTYIVQVNGKMRGRFDLPKDKSQDEIFTAAKSQPNIAKFIEGKEIKRVIFVPNKLLNIVAP